MKRGRLFDQLDDERVEIGVRAAALGLAYAVSVLTGTARDIAPQLLLLTLLAVAAVLPLNSRGFRRWRPVFEALVAGLLIATANPYDPSLLPYIVTPALSAGLIGGWSLAVISSGAAMLGLLLPGVQGAGGLGGSEYVVDAVQWSLLALAVGLLAAWVRRVQTEPPDDDESYLEAARLLVQLRDLSRELSGGLDAISLASSLLDDVRTQFGMTRGWVFGYRTGGAPIPLAFGPGIDPGLAADFVSGPLWSRAVTDQTTQHTTGPLSSDQSMSGAVLPLRIRSTVVGLLAIERRGEPWTRPELAQIQVVADAEAVRFDAALLFDEVRTMATAEERQRLAREIHDGIAQEIASLGYLVDDLQSRAPGEFGADLAKLREELTRTVTELRHSIFDLRREVGPGASLTSVLADHARYVGEVAGIAVHLELSESAARLRPAVESELLRIAQEAIANARRHSKARNLWVTCMIDAPNVVLTVEDDGRGLLPPREDSFGLVIMQERAARAGCTLSVTNRLGGGTSVAVRPLDPRSEGVRPVTSSKTQEGGGS